MRLEGLSYAGAGVDIAAYERALERVKPLIAATAGPEVASGVGPFAGLYRSPSGGYLAASADGVGTKIRVAIALGSHRGIGWEAVTEAAIRAHAERFGRARFGDEMDALVREELGQAW